MEVQDQCEVLSFWVQLDETSNIRLHQEQVWEVTFPESIIVFTLIWKILFRNPVKCNQ